MDRWLKRLADLSTTNFRILDSVILANICIVTVLAAMVLGWQPTDPQLNALYAIGVFLLTMMGLDVLQFASKRYSDSALAAARNSAITGPIASEPPASGSVEMTPKPAVVVAGAPTVTTVIKPTPDPRAEIDAPQSGTAASAHAFDPGA